MDVSMDIVRSFVHPSPKPQLGQAEFDVLVTTHLKKNANFRPHNFAPYFFNFIMGAMMMVPETRLKAELGVEKAYWKIMPNKVGLKFVFFVTVNRKLTMQVRNVFLTDDYKNWERGLSSIEYSTLKQRVSMILGDISSYEKHVEEYVIKDYEMYLEGKTVGGRQKMPMMVRKLHTVDSIIFTDNSDVRDENFRPLRQQLDSPQIDPQTGRVIKPLEVKIRQLKNAHGEEYVEKVKGLLGALVSIYQEGKRKQSIPFEEWNGADCGFLHGAMLALSEKVQLIPTVQHHMLPGAFDPESGRVGRFYLALHPQFEPEAKSVSGVGAKLPVAISFTQDLSEESIEKMKRFDWLMMRRSSLHDANWSDKIVLTQLNFRKEDPSRAEFIVNDAIYRQEILNNFELFYERIMQNEEFSAEKFVDYVQSIMDSIRYTGVPHDISETNYVSRYFLSMLASIHSLREHNLDTFVFKPQNDQETCFLIKSKGNGQVKIIIKIIEKPMLEEKQKSKLDIDTILGEPVIVRPVQPTDDTIILTISQEYQHSQASFVTTDNVEDFINREVSINYGTFSQLAHDPDSMNNIEPFRVDTGLLYALADNGIEDFGEDLESFLNEYSPYLNRRSSFQAFVEGLFHSTKHASRIVPLKSLDSASQMAISTPLETPEAAESHLTVFNFVYTQDETTDNKEKSTGVFSTIRRRLKGAKNHILNIIYNMARSTATTMIDRGGLPNPDCRRRKRAISNSCSRKKITTIEDTEAYHEFPKTKAALETLGQVSNGIMAGLMLRDFIADLIRGDNKAALRDASFFGGALLSGRIAAAAEIYAAKMIESGRFLAGTTLKVVAPILRRVTSLYVLSGLIDAIEAYRENKNDTAALVNVIADSTFLTVDAAETGIELLELFDVIEGVSATTGPIGMTIGAILLCGTTVYETVQRMKSLNAQIQLTPFEELDETFRAIFHLNIENEVEQSMKKRKINQILYEEGAKILAGQKSLKYYITSTADLIGGHLKYANISLIDLRYGVKSINVDRTSPLQTNKDIPIFCKLIKQPSNAEERPLTAWQKLKSKFNAIVADVKILIDYIEGDTNAMLRDAAQYDDASLERGYPCFESFGIENSGSTGSTAYFQLTDGFRKIYGFPNSSNMFNCSNGLKILHGGNENDHFILNGDDIEGFLFGDDGLDHLDLSKFYMQGVLKIQEQGLIYNMDTKRIILHSIESLIGRKNLREVIVATCRFKYIDTRGCHNNSHDDIFINKNPSCDTYNTTIVLRNHTYVDNDAPAGIFNYIIPDSEQHNIKLVVRGYQNISHVIQITDEITNFNIPSTFRYAHNWGHASFYKDNNMILTISIGNDTSGLQIHFLDGVILKMKSHHLFAHLKTDLTVEEIVRKYDTFLRNSGLTMVAYSSTDQKSITFNHGTHKIHHGQKSSFSLNVMYNDPNRESHIICRDGENVLLLKQNITIDKLPSIVIDCSLSPSAKLVLDFSLIVNQLAMNTSTYYHELKLEPFFISTNNISLTLTLRSILNPNFRFRTLGFILIEHGEILSFYDKIEIITNGLTTQHIKNRKEVQMQSFGYSIIDEGGRHDQTNDLATTNIFLTREEVTGMQQNVLYLEADPLIFTANKSGQIYLTTEDIHDNQVVHVGRRLRNSYEFYKLNQTLIISNIDKALFWDLENQITIVLENFYIRPKFKTLKFVFLDKAKITIIGHLYEIAKAGSMDDLWQKVMTNDVLYYEQ